MQHSRLKKNRSMVVGNISAATSVIDHDLVKGERMWQTFRSQRLQEWIMLSFDFLCGVKEAERSTRKCARHVSSWNVTTKQEKFHITLGT